jgi:GntR family transcriptional regulator
MLQAGTLDRRSPIPLHFQLSETLRQQIENQEFKQGDMLPSEHELMEMYQVSRNTVRKALDALVRINLLHRTHGVGSIVLTAGLYINFKINGFVEHHELIRRAGYDPGCETLTIRKINDGERLPKPLNTLPGEEVLLIESLYRADDVPAIYARDFVLVSSPESEEEAVRAGKTFFDFLQAQKGHQVQFVLSDIVPVVANERIASLLECEVGTPLLSLPGSFLDPLCKHPLAVCESFYNPQIVKFSVLRERESCTRINLSQGL